MEEYKWNAEQNRYEHVHIKYSKNYKIIEIKLLTPVNFRKIQHKSDITYLRKISLVFSSNIKNKKYKKKKKNKKKNASSQPINDLKYKILEKYKK